MSVRYDCEFRYELLEEVEIRRRDKATAAELADDYGDLRERVEFDNVKKRTIKQQLKLQECI